MRFGIFSRILGFGVLFLCAISGAFAAPENSSIDRCRTILGQLPKLDYAVQRANLQEFVLNNDTYLKRMRSPEAGAMIDLLNELVRVGPEGRRFIRLADKILKYIPEAQDPGVGPGLKSTAEYNYRMQLKLYQVVLELVASASSLNPSVRLPKLFAQPSGFVSETPSLRQFILLHALHSPDPNGGPWLMVYQHNFSDHFSYFSESEFKLIKTHLTRPLEADTEQNARNLLVDALRANVLTPEQIIEVFSYARALSAPDFIQAVIPAVPQSSDRRVHMFLEEMRDSDNAQTRRLAQMKLLSLGDEQSVDALLQEIRSIKDVDGLLEKLNHLPEPSRLSAAQIEDVLLTYVMTIKDQNDPKYFWLLPWDHIHWGEYITPVIRDQIIYSAKMALTRNSKMAPVAFRMGQSLRDSGLVQRSLNTAYTRGDLALVGQTFVQSLPAYLSSAERKKIWDMGISVLRQSAKESWPSSLVSQSPSEIWSTQVLLHTFEFWRDTDISFFQHDQFARVCNELIRKHSSMDIFEERLIDFLNGDDDD